MIANLIANFFSASLLSFMLLFFPNHMASPLVETSTSSTDNTEVEDRNGPVYKPLRTCKDQALQAALEQVLNKNPKWNRLIKSKKLSVGLVDMRDANNTKFAQINGKEMMYAASLPKIAILFAAMDAIENGELRETPEVRRDMHLMIAKSNNQASTRMIDRVGYAKIEAVLTDPRYALYDRKEGGGLWVGKRYAAGGARNPDPMKGLSHAATAEQVCRFYYMVAKGQLINEQRSQQMMEYLADPLLHHKFVHTLDKVAPKARLYRKSGSWSNFHSDSVLVWGDPSQRYVLVALTEDPQGEQIIRNLVYAAEKALKNTSTMPMIAKK